MKVGIVAENYFPTLGGIQEHIRHLRNFLVDRKVEVTILTGNPSVNGTVPGPKDANNCVVRVGKARSYGTGGTTTQATAGPRVWWNMHKAIRAGKFDLLNIHGPGDFGLPFFGLTQFAGPKVLTLHSCFPDAKWRHRVSPYYRWAFGRASAVIAVSEATRNSMQRYANFHANIVPNGVDVRYWEQGRPTARYKAPGIRNIVYVGRLEDRNGPDILIDALPEILRAAPNVRLLIAGDGPRRAALEARILPALRDRVLFLGAVYDERPDILASSTLFLLPARAVGFSIMVLEAFAAGLPVVALPSLGTNQAGKHWDNVLLSADDSVGAYARAVTDALAQNQDSRIAKGRVVASAFDWSEVGPSILDVFQSVLRPAIQSSNKPQSHQLAAVF